ncbi:uncharacterized protein LOC131986874 [Centropristis striata]|uniref:uncharacterized protein LOC131986874 n=1 Tax=Centropristis striata TaxID=184440 RepID=UPI0027E10756|nr:uncharacterized protein LOC131986874 [Centropristis striata]
MNGLLFLLYCTEMGALLCGAQNTAGPDIEQTSSQTPQEYSTIAGDITAKASPKTPPVGLTSVDSSKSTAALWPSTVSQHSKDHNHSPGAEPIPTSSFMFYRKECLPVFFVAGGLIIACVFFLICTLLLMWKVCQLNRRIKMLSSNADLISTTDYYVETANKNKKREETEAKETAVLMSDIQQAQEETDNGTTKEEGEKVTEDGQTEEGNKKEVEDAAKSEDAAATPAEDASSSKPHEEAPDSPCTDAVAAPPSQVTEEIKDVV